MADRRTLAIAAAALVAIVAVVVIVVTAIVPVPDFTPLADASLTGYAAFTVDGDARTLVVVDLTDGSQVESDVGRETEVLGFDDEGSLVAVEYGAANRLVFIDPASGEQTGTEQVDGDPWEEFRPEAVWTDWDDGRVVLEVESGDEASFEAPEGYQVGAAAPYGTEGIVFVDSIGRVAITGFGEAVTPVLVAEDGVTWGAVAATP